MLITSYRDLKEARSIPSRKGGFALVISLTLMGFVLTLLITLIAMVRVETQASFQRQSIAQSRMNALLGLNVALGQLQKFAGPDRRVSALADLGQGGSGAITSKSGAHYWTGIWGNAAEVETLSSEPRLLNWLVSGNEHIDFTTSASGSVITNTEATFTPDMGAIPSVTHGASALDDLENGGQRWSLLLGGNTRGELPGDENGYVLAPIVAVPSEGQGTGGYAYWVGDEGVKARANLIESDTVLYPRSEDEEEMSELRYRRPSRYGLESMEDPWLVDFSVMTDPDGSLGNQLRGKLDRLSSVSGLALLDEINDVFPKEHFHDVSLWSRGVLSNTLGGGLKKDLTAAFAMGTDQSDEPVGLIWEDVKTQVAGNLGPAWQLLRSWYQFSDIVGTSLPVKKIDWDGNHALTPVIAHWQFFVEGRVEVVNAVTNEYRLGFRMYPALVLWNPYDVALQEQTFTCDYANGTINEPNRMAFMLRVWKNGSEDLPAAFDADAQMIAPWTLESDSGGDPVPFRFTVDSGRMEPGMAYIYTMEQDVTYADAEGADNYRLVRGWNFDGVNPAAVIAWSGQTFTLPEADDPDDYTVSYWISGGSAGADLNNLDWNDSISGVNNNLDWGLIGREALELNIPGTSGSLRVQSIEEINGSFRTSLSPDLWKRGSAPSLSTASSRGNAGFYGQRWTLKATETSPLYLTGSSTELEYNNPIRWLANFNPRALFSTRSPFENQSVASNGYFNNNPSYNRVTQQSDRASSFFDPASPSFLIDFDPDSWTVPVGMSQSLLSASPPPVILFSVPRPESRILSIGALQHANPFRPASTSGAIWATNTAPAYTIGNSLANPRIGLDRFRLKANEVTHKNGIYGSSDYMLDHSYILNRSLWDKYYFSSVPQAPEEVSFPLDNALYSRYGGGSDLDLRNYDEAAANLMVEGAFNINSTSEAAWRALLASFNNIPVNGEVMLNQSAYPRTAIPSATSFDPDSVTEASISEGAYNGGFRYLTQTQINALAQAIVSEVKLRGPFVTLSDFVNRSLAGGEHSQLAGALASAIGQTDINAGFDGETSELKSGASMDAAENLSAVANEGQTASHVPGWVSQADLLQSLGPILSARSDTFIIRAYGEVLNPTSGEVEGRSWCEAVVQRYPDYVNGALASANPDASNQTFGRRFKIVSFSWLSSDEI
ncbi:hypothetical protein QEH59_10280 [Coraliomargarita sp. SDUM461004]|uniref:Uncharacterized protein n=1 Tax=Thalassobacterium sedimentorum TaxID=3041258 RepID=A0ABU1AJ14_9BACT|nr:hypothetical protein [Coraliomargarita sp. SDUM461004]MDQ8194814.1 hypothetical protein [Coraliomargarita sp. SDUM461004]